MSSDSSDVTFKQMTIFPPVNFFPAKYFFPAMARFRRFRRYRRGYRRWKRWRRARRAFSGSRRIINNSSRTRVSIKCRASQDVSLQIPVNGLWSDMLVATPWIANRTVGTAAPTRANIFCAPIITSPAFTSFAAVYDEVRLTGVRYVINCRSNIGAGGIPSITFHTCWERSKPVNSFVNTAPNATTISNSPSAQSVTALNNTVNKFSRSCYPSDLFERIDFVNSQTYDKNLEVNNFAMPPSTAHSTVQTTMIVAAGEDPHEGHPSFFPVFYLVANAHGTAEVLRTLDLNITCYCTFEFRGPKYGNSNSASASLAVKGALVDEDHAAPDAGDDVQLVPPNAFNRAVQDVARPYGQGVQRAAAVGAAALEAAVRNPRVRRAVMQGVGRVVGLPDDTIDNAADLVDDVIDAFNGRGVGRTDWNEWRRRVLDGGDAAAAAPGHADEHDEL